jgi:hypothetical protein
MSRPPQPDDLSVSLEPHLIEILRPLVDTVPAPLSADLSPLLSETASCSSTPTISYALLQSVSRWARTEEAARALRSKNPPLDPLAYNMVALLAGTRTSPDKKFPQLPHSPTRVESAARDIGDRRAIIAVLNALLSVICTGAATWWAAQRTGWRDEWVRDPVTFGMVLSFLTLRSKSRKFSCHCSLQQSSRFQRLDCTSYGNPAKENDSQPGPADDPPAAILLPTPTLTMST